MKAAIGTIILALSVLGIHGVARADTIVYTFHSYSEGTAPGFVFQSSGFITGPMTLTPDQLSTIYCGSIDGCFSDGGHVAFEPGVPFKDTVLLFDRIWVFPTEGEGWLFDFPQGSFTQVGFYSDVGGEHGSIGGNLTVTQIPEPGTILLMSTGLAVIVAKRRKTDRGCA